MTPAELRAHRNKLALSQAVLAKRLDIGERNYRSYELGEYPVPVVVALAVERLVIEKEKA